jgi:hypothetical protein
LTIVVGESSFLFPRTLLLGVESCPTHDGDKENDGLDKAVMPDTLSVIGFDFSLWAFFIGNAEQ